jgi:L-ascorbate metabolism protein UlaG (beta-lactamase superfamily)
VKEIGTVDVLFVPVGGRYTIDAKEAWGVVEILQPKIVIPMHFATPHLSFALAPVEEFISHYDMVIKKPYLEVTSGNLGLNTRIIILDYL